MQTHKHTALYVISADLIYVLSRAVALTATVVVALTGVMVQANGKPAAAVIVYAWAAVFLVVGWELAGALSRWVDQERDSHLAAVRRVGR